MSHDIQVTNSANDFVTLKNAGAADSPASAHIQHVLDDVNGKGKKTENFNPAGDSLLWQNPLKDKDLPKIESVLIATPVASDKDRDGAGKTLEKGISKLIPEGDRATIKGMTDAITHGDPHALAEAIKAAHGDPQKLKNLCTEVDKMLAAKGSTARLDVTANGSVVLSDGSQDKAVVIGASGEVSVRGVEHNVDGSRTLKPGELLNVDSDEVCRNIGDGAVNDVNGVGLKGHGQGGQIGDLPLPNPFAPMSPRRPIEPFEPLEPIKRWEDSPNKRPANFNPSVFELKMN